MTTVEPSLSEGQPAATKPAGRGLPGLAAWLPTWDLITTKNLEIRKRRGLMVTMAVLIVAPTVLLYALRLLFHAVDPNRYGLAGTPDLFSQVSNLVSGLGFIAAATLGATAGTTDLTDGMFRHLVITGRSRGALYLARIPAGLAVIIPLVALAFTMNCLVTSFEGSPDRTSVALYGVNAPQHLDQAGLQAWLLRSPVQHATNLPLDLGPGVAAPSVAQARTAIDGDIGPLYADYVASELSGSNPADNEMVKIGLWLELDTGIAFLIGLGLGSLTGQRTNTTIVLIALQVIVTPLLSRTQIPYFIDGQRLIVGIALDQLRPAALASSNAGAGGVPGAVLFGGRGALGIPPMPTWAMVAVIVGWIVGWSGIGAWRMKTRDA